MMKGSWRAGSEVMSVAYSKHDSGGKLKESGKRRVRERELDRYKFP